MGSRDVLSGELLKILACPQCKGGLELNKAGNDLICQKCMIEYPVRGDMPILLPVI